MSREKIKAELSALNLLRQVFLKEPEIDLLEGISRVAVPSGQSGEAGGLPKMVDSVRKNKDRLAEWKEELSVEFARLFIGPAHPPAVPYASFYLSETHSLMTEETMAVRKQYLGAGLAVKNLYSLPDDHIGIELEFIFHLTWKALELSEAGKDSEAMRILQNRKEFLKEHMVLWVPTFVERILESTHQDFYRGAALFLRELIEYAIPA